MRPGWPARGGCNCRTRKRCGSGVAVRRRINTQTAWRVSSLVTPPPQHPPAHNGLFPKPRREFGRPPQALLEQGPAQSGVRPQRGERERGECEESSAGGVWWLCRSKYSLKTHLRSFVLEQLPSQPPPPPPVHTPPPQPPQLLSQMPATVPCQVRCADVRLDRAHWIRESSIGRARRSAAARMPS